MTPKASGRRNGSAPAGAGTAGSGSGPQVTRLRAQAREVKIATTGFTRAALGQGGNLPHFLVVGAQRAGTTSLYRYLAAHPDVLPARTKEIQYFSLHYGRGEAWYRGLFPVCGPGQQTFEASPLYLFDDRVPGRVRETIPNARFIALLRDPVERAYSHYLHNRQHGFETLPFADAVQAEPARLGLTPDGTMTAGRKQQRRYSYLARGRYADQLRAWRAVFPAEQLLVLRSEDLYQQPAVTYAAVLAHLGLPAQPGLTFRVHNHWADAQRQLTPALQSRLREQFEEPNRDLARLLGWSHTWGAEPSEDPAG